jgi:CRP-like cAMP-binding protein
MFAYFRRYLRDKISLTETELARIESLAIPKRMHRKQYLLREGDLCRHYTFVSNGCLKLFRIGEQGTEHIMRFAIENWWVCDRESLLTGDPAKCNIQALEDCEILLWTKENFRRLQTEMPAYRDMQERLIEGFLVATMNRVYDNISLTAEEKYQQFLHMYPSVHNRVPLHMIASYLGVSRETLSRIRIQYATSGSDCRE